jgi:hypothetical protein
MVENRNFKLTMTKGENWSVSPLATHAIYAKDNMAIICETITINIYNNPRVMENVFIGAYYSFDEVHIYTDLFKEFCNVFTQTYE